MPERTDKMIKHAGRTPDGTKSAIREGCMRLLDFSPVHLVQGLVSGFLADMCVTISCLASEL
jgi:hypothetical protein